LQYSQTDLSPKSPLPIAPAARCEGHDPQQIDHGRKLIEDGKRREYVADQFKAGRFTLYRALRHP
jgi:hypothetical protein